MTYIITDEDNIPEELLKAKKVAVMSSIGWITIEDKPDFRVGLKYKILEEG